MTVNLLCWFIWVEGTVIQLTAAEMAALFEGLDWARVMLAAERVENERLRKIIRELQRHRFGRRAESLPADQMLLGLEEAEQVEADDQANTEAQAPTERITRVIQRRANRGSLPPHLPRIETVVDIADRTCPCCAAPLHRTGEDMSERLDVVPAQVRVLVVRRPRYACRACTTHAAPAPMAWCTEALHGIVDERFE